MRWLRRRLLQGGIGHSSAAQVGAPLDSRHEANRIVDVTDDDVALQGAEIASVFLDVPSVTPRVITDKVKECFSILKSEQGMAVVLFDNVQLRCGIGPDINWGRIVIGHIN